MRLKVLTLLTEKTLRKFSNWNTFITANNNANNNLFILSWCFYKTKIRFRFVNFENNQELWIRFHSVIAITLSFIFKTAYLFYGQQLQQLQRMTPVQASRPWPNARSLFTQQRMGTRWKRGFLKTCKNFLHNIPYYSEFLSDLHPKNDSAISYEESQFLPAML